MGVEEIQDMVELKLMQSERPDVAKAYILYREERSKIWYTFEIDPETGYAIDPETGEFVDPETGDKIFGDEPFMELVEEETE